MLVEPLVAFLAMLVAWVVILTLVLRQSATRSGRRQHRSRVLARQPERSRK